MSESNPKIPLPSQESASDVVNCSNVEPDIRAVFGESENSGKVKLQPSKIAKPAVLQLPPANTTTPVTRVGRLCNNISKPAVPSNPATKETRAGGRGGRTMSTSFIRRINDELARKRLTDVDETNESTASYYRNGNSSYDRKMSSGSVLSDSSRKSDEFRKKRSSDAFTSPDSYIDYWKNDFEPRRSSDASVVLTEDTDQFIIGDRVWVGGVKPGQIAYIGETQFAPGEWAGVVLDEPIGKNDGTVANIRYFQCEPKKGIFSRLTRLTRFPLVEGGAGEPGASRTMPGESRRSNGSLSASVPKKSTLILTPASSKNPISKPPSPDSSLNSNVQVGDRVIVKSSQGSKAGVLRYLGTTDFAPGEWCGVELDDPLGKNDGSVSGTRYFECRPKFGLFAPLHKVSKSPANRRFSQGNCVIHNRGGTTAPGIRRQGSKESLGSVASTASTAASVRSTARKIGVRTPTTPTSAKNALQLRPQSLIPFQIDVYEVDECGWLDCQGEVRDCVESQGSPTLLASEKKDGELIFEKGPDNYLHVSRPFSDPDPFMFLAQETLKEKELHIEQLLKERDLERAEVTRAASQADEAERRLVALKQEFEQQREEAEARVSDLDAMVCLLKSENEELKNLLDDERKKLEDLQFRFEEEAIDKADLKSMSVNYEEKMKILEKTLFEERKRTEALEQDSNKLFEAEEQMVIIKDELDSAREEISELKKTQSTLEQERISLEAHLTSTRAEIESLKIENESLKSSTFQKETDSRENLSKIVQAFEECKKELEKKERERECLENEMTAKDQNFSEKENELHAKYLKVINELTDKQKSETENLLRQLQDLKSHSESKLKILENQLEEKIKLCNSLEIQLNDVNVLLSKSSAEKLFEENKQREEEERLQEELKRVKEEVVRKNEELVEENTKCEKVFRENQKLEKELEETRKLLMAANELTENQVTELKEAVEKHKEELNKMKNVVECKSKECEFLQETLATSNVEKEKELRDMELTIAKKNFDVENLKKEVMKQKEEFDVKSREFKQLYETHEESFKERIKSLEEAEAKEKKEIETLTRELEKVQSLFLATESQLTSEKEKNQNLVGKLMDLEENRKKISEEKNQMQLEAGDTARKLQSLEDKLALVTNQKAKLELDISNFINSSNDSSRQLIKQNEDLRSKEKELDTLREDISQKTQNFERVEQELKQILEKQEIEARTLKEELEKIRRDHKLETEGLRKKLEASNASLSSVDLEWKQRMENLKTESTLRVKLLEEQIRLMEKKEFENKDKHEEDVNKLKNAREELNAKLTEAETREIMCKNLLEKKINELSLERKSLLESFEKAKAEFLNSEKQTAEKMKKDAEAFASESEKLRNELKETTDKLATTVEELTKVKSEKNKLNEEKFKLEKSTSTMEGFLKELQEKNRNLEVSVTSIESENKVLKGVINQMREEKGLLDKESTEKLMQVTELRSQLEALEYSRKMQETEDEVKIRNLEAEISELKTKLQKSDASHSTETLENCRQIGELRNEIERLKQESSQMLSKKENDVESAKAAMTQLRKELDESLSELKRKREQMGKTETQFEQTRKELESEKKKCENYGNRLNASEAERIDLKERLEQQSKLLVHGAALGAELADARQKLSEVEGREQEMISNAKLEKETLKKMLETANNLLSQKENETKTLIKELEALKQEKTDLINCYNTVGEAADSENAKMQIQLEETKKAEKVKPDLTAEDVAQRELQEEREFQKGQVDFLNSVIVDMQKKNDALKARIEILEMGFSPEDVDEFNLHNITPKSVAPRLFCDICDRFDLHDTEDCPTQANEDVPLPKSSKVKIPPPERPYCEICEVFGHDTADCDDGETF